MDALRWQRIDELFQAAIARAGDARAAFLSDACAGDETLAREVQRLVRAHERSRGFLERPVTAKALRIIASADASAAIDPSLTGFHAGLEFRGTERFTVRRQLGAGGMGVVYEVHDRDRDEVVALKTLLRARAGDIYRLKREFRSLSDVAHPNLVSLYELIVESTDCFFTMELVNGVDFVEYVRGSVAASVPLDPAKVRLVLRQLVEGIGALHQQGKLHRDIKPSNVLITPAGRVVVLDFGLACDVVRAAAIADVMAGTPAYLAPERHVRAAPSESDDWYSVGVTLYEALTGHVPFDGSFEDVGRRKRESDARPPAASAPDVPEDLDAICTGLLRRDPARRLSGRQVLEMLESDLAIGIAPSSDTADVEPRLVGRRRQLATLEDGFSRAKGGTATTVYVNGPSGIGKTALVEHFLDRLLSREDIVVLRGRCYERESVPYKALDGVIDSLSHYLHGLPWSQAEELMPADLAPLLRLFPVMLQAGAASRARAPERESGDPLVLRQRAFDALRDLLGRIAARRPVAVFIDDLHWADADSAVLLEDLLRPPHAPPILTIACFRLEEVESKPFLQALLERVATKAATGLSLEPMADDEARMLLVSAMAANPAVSEAELAALTKDAAGNPFLLRHLADYLATHRGGSARATFTQILDERLAALPSGEQHFLEALAICGRAMSPKVLHEAAGLAGDERPLVARLRASRFLRASGSAHRVELYHDRIRDALAGRLSPGDRRRLHGVIAQVLVARAADDAEALYEHYREAGSHGEASRQAALAAQKADATLAFDRAAAYYRAALELSIDAGAHVEWKERLAAALANAGRPAESADAYLDAAGDAPPARRVELRRAAAEQLLTGGHIDRGLDVITTILPAVRLRFTRGVRGAIASFIWHRLRLQWRGLGFVEGEPDRIPPADLLRIDTCWSVAAGLALVDHVHAADFQTRHLLLALDAGEPYRIARAIAAELFVFAAGGSAGRRKTLERVARAEAIAARVGSPHAIALCAIARGATGFLTGDWPAALAHCEQSLDLLRSQSVSTWERNTIQQFRLGTLMYQGELRQVARELPALLDSARTQGNLYFETELRTRFHLLWLMADRPDEGRQQATDVMRRWSHAGFHRQHYNYMVDCIQTELYCGRAPTAWKVITDDWQAVQRAHLLRVQYVRIEAWYLRARCALLMAAHEVNRGRFLAVARDAARRLGREHHPWSQPLASLVMAAVAHLEARPQLARDRLTDSAAGFERAQMKLYIAVARRRLGELAPDAVSQQGRQQANDWMAAEGIVSPSRMTRLIAPGFPDEPEAM